MSRAWRLRTSTPAPRFGHYEILGRIGAGGMGEVFRARDARLNRDVALKQLPESFAADKDRLGRFRREAQVLASLNHPHIASIHGLEEVDGRIALVLELVEGETLEARIKRGAIPLEEAVPLARQMAEALEAAHEKGVIHRDLKPANVKVTPEGQVKLLDFGLAKAYEGRDPSTDTNVSASPTLSRNMTEAGLIMGTAAYMSPEQARGRPVDKRADIWSFGIVTFEMLAGRPLFTGETVTDILAAVVRQDIEWSALPPSVPPPLRRLLQRCLERDPKSRLRDIGEARLLLSAPLASDEPPSGSAARSRPAASRLAAATALLAVAGWTTAGLLLWREGRRPSPPVVRYDVPPPEKATLDLEERPALDLAPHGARLTFVARRDGVARLYLRDRQDAEPRPLVGTEGASNPVFSPSGREIAFFAQNTLKKVTLDGSVTTVATAAGDPRGLAWLDTDRIVFAPDAIGGLMEVAAHGGDPRPATTLDAKAGERTHRWPHALPGGKAVLFTAGTFASPDDYDAATIVAVVLATGERRTVLRAARAARYASTGHLLFARGATLYAVAFDRDTLAAADGEPRTLLRGVDGVTPTGASHFAVAEDGTLAYVPGTSQGGQRKLTWRSVDGSQEDLDLPAGFSYSDVRLSPDGSRFALAAGASGSADIWVYDIARKAGTRLTFDGRSATPEWSADGTSVFFATVEPTGTKTTIFRRPADGSRQAEQVASTPGRTYLGGIEKDGSLIGVTYGDAARGANTAIVRVKTGASEAEMIADTPADEYAPRLSPDGRWLAFQADPSGDDEVYVHDLGDTGARWQVSARGGVEPNWSPDGRALYYREDTRLMKVAVETHGRFHAGPPSLVMDGVYDIRSDTGISYQVMPKGDRFLTIRPAVIEDRSAVVRVVLNFFRELRREVSTAQE